jgi:two-component system phosphate regulon sensor histidine kinase PhoR
MKGEFLSRVAHDLRTPLASIIWSARNMLDGVKGTLSEGQAEYLRSVRASAEHLNRLVANLLEISRIEQGRGALDLAPVLLRPVLEQAIVTLRPIASEKGIEVRLDAPDGLGPVMGNEDCLLEVAINLLDNATRYSPPSGEIAVTVRAAPAGYQTLEVRDHGPGLADADAERLFERFSQGPRSPHTGTLGFGLGLCIVKSHVEMMRGQVTAANHPMGGAVFSCSIPEPDPERIPR